MPATAPRQSPSSRKTVRRDLFTRGLAEGRRTAEAELVAERQAVAVLANSMALLVDNLVLSLHPADLCLLDGDKIDLRILPDSSLPSGAVRIEGRV